VSRGDPRHRLKAIRALVAGSPTKLRMTLQRAPPRGIPRRRCSVQSPGATPVRGSTPTPSTCRHRAQASSHWRTPAKAGRARRYRIEILPLWAPCAPAVSFFGGGVPGMNGWCRACAAGRALRRVTPCPTAPPAGIAASADGVAAVADAASDPRRGIVPTEVTGMPPRRKRRYSRQPPQAMATRQFVHLPATPPGYRQAVASDEHSSKSEP
jgi:hypothetical protein